MPRAITKVKTNLGNTAKKIWQPGALERHASCRLQQAALFENSAALFSIHARVHAAPTSAQTKPNNALSPASELSFFGGEMCSSFFFSFCFFRETCSSQQFIAPLEI